MFFPFSNINIRKMERTYFSRCFLNRDLKTNVMHSST